MTQFNLFDYPFAAGSKENTTSRENAERIEASGKAQALREKCQKFFEEGFQGTADELADLLGVHFLCIRPRVSELNKRGLVEHTGERRINATGGTAHVWRKKTP